MIRLLPPLLLLLILPLRSAAQDPAKKPAPDEEALSIETNLVVVNVTLKDARNQYVPGLTAANFQILEDAVAQRILSFGYEESPFAAAILLDASGSLENKLSLVRAACSTFVEGIREGDAYSIYSFGDGKVRKLQDFTEVRDIPDAVWDMKAKGRTPLYDAIVQASEALARRPEKRRAILVVSDGADTESRASLDQAVRKAVEAHLLVYAVDMSDRAVYGASAGPGGAGILKNMAVRTGGQFFQTPGGGKLREAFAATVEELRHQYTLTYVSANELQDGKWRAIEVRVDRPNLSIRTRQGYWAQKRKN